MNSDHLSAGDNDTFHVEAGKRYLLRASCSAGDADVLGLGSFPYIPVGEPDKPWAKAALKLRVSRGQKYTRPRSGKAPRRW